MTSTSDAKDILGIPSTPSPPLHISKKLKGTSSGLKDGSKKRELYNLLGTNTPPVVVIQNKFKERPKWQEKVTPWRWVGFKNDARANPDDLILHHWVRGEAPASDNVEEEYPFAKYNKGVEVPSFTKEEYEKNFTNKDWSYEETAYFFDLCREYDLRWIVIHDRYEWNEKNGPGGESPEPANEQEDVEMKDPSDDEGDEHDRNGEVKEVAKEKTNDGEEIVEQTTNNGKSGGAKVNDNGSQSDDKHNNDEVEREDTTLDTSADTSAPKSSNSAAIDATPGENSVSNDKEEPSSTSSFKTKKSRTIEDLRDRYYEISRKIMDLRREMPDGLSPQDEEIYKMMKFNKEAERIRKDHLEKLLARSPAEIAEEEALVIESRKLEAAAERLIAERQEILRLLESPLSSGQISQYQNSQGIAQLTQTLFADKSKRRKVEPSTPVSTSAPSGAASSSGTSTPIGSNNSAAASVRVKNEIKKSSMLKKYTPKEEAAIGITYHEKLHPGAYVRSSKLNIVKSTSLQTKVKAVLAELNLPVRPVMPTAKVCAKFDALQQQIVLLLEAKKQADKLQTELAIQAETKQ